MSVYATLAWKQVVDFYSADAHKPYIYYAALSLWSAFLVFIVAFAALLAQNSDRTWFYVFVVFVVPFLALLTYWKHSCERAAYRVVYHGVANHPIEEHQTEIFVGE